jgi:chorismate-pyruvate lyase
MHRPGSPPNLESVAGIIHPLDAFYAEAGLHLPPYTQVDPESVPEPYAGLLVHRTDMTPTLEKFHGQAIHLRVLRSWRKADEYFREVVLVLDGNDEPVEFGAIKINLDLFSQVVRDHILTEHQPLGHILEEHKVPHRSEPCGFLRLASDPLINRALNLSGAQVLYGRRNNLLDAPGRPLAEIVEILPPVRGKETKRKEA